MIGEGVRIAERASEAELPSWGAPSDEAWEAAKEAISTPASPPWPGPGEYLMDLAFRLRRWLAGWIEGWIEGSVPAWLASDALWLGLVYGIALLAVVIVGVLAVRILRGRRISTAEGGPRIEVGPTGDEAGIPEAQICAERFRNARARGAWREALEALWWWGATSVAPPGLSPAWTTEQLLTASGRRELVRPFRELDRLRYGRDSLDADRVLGVEHGLREALS